MLSMNYLILSFAHILGDFYFQCGQLAAEKESRFLGVVKHSCLYSIAVLLCALIVEIRLSVLIVLLAFAVSHFVVDSIKYLVVNHLGKEKKELVYIIDQIVHFLNIAVFSHLMVIMDCSLSVCCWVESFLENYRINFATTIKWVLSLLIICKPVNVTIGILLKRYKDDSSKNNSTDNNHAGRYIGILERVIILILFYVGQYASLGFVLTAKSIARYDTIKKEASFVDYYLLGTLISSLSAILCRLIILR